MTDIPIIMSGPMIKATLREIEHPGTGKTETRRIIKLPTKGEYVRADMGGWAPTTVGGGSVFRVRRGGLRELVPELVAIWNQTTGTCIASRYQPGDRLWVRESLIRDRAGWLYATGHQPVAMDACDPRTPAMIAWAHHYERDAAPSIHMPRWASRLTLIVRAVKIERLQDITAASAQAEGATSRPKCFGLGEAGWSMDWGDVEPRNVALASAQLAFGNFWLRLHGPDSWDANPWIVAISFTPHLVNIDQMKAEAA